MERKLQPLARPECPEQRLRCIQIVAIQPPGPPPIPPPRQHQPPPRPFLLRQTHLNGPQRPLLDRADQVGVRERIPIEVAQRLPRILRHPYVHSPSSSPGPDSQGPLSREEFHSTAPFSWP